MYYDLPFTSFVFMHLKQLIKYFIIIYRKILNVSPFEYKPTPIISLLITNTNFPPNISPPNMSPPIRVYEPLYAQGLYSGFYGIFCQS